MTAVIHDLQQGSNTWLQFRSAHFGASEAAAMLGLSKHTSRSELLRLKSTGLGREYCDWVQKNVLDRGHHIEAAIRGHVEKILDDSLYPVTCSKPGTKLSTSCDGLTLGGETAWENKQWNAELAAAVEAGIVPDDHMPQCQQILMVTDAQRVLFTVTDGTPEKFVSVEVLPDPQWFERITRGWQQFENDLSAYVPPEAAPVINATPQANLPALSVQLQGALAVVSNLAPFGVALREFISRIPTKPSTDQEFADTEAACKRLKEAEERLQQAEDGALASMSDVEAMRRMVADFRDLARTTRLASEKLVTARKAQIREEEVQRGRVALAGHVAALVTRLGKPYMPAVAADFAGSIKGLKTLDSVRNAIDTELARAKIDASALADKIETNLKAIAAAGDGMAGLFADEAVLVLKAPDDLAAVIAQRVAAENLRQDQARERIRQEEAARLEREQAAAAVVAAPAVPVTTPAPSVAPMPATASAGPTMNLGMVCNRLGFIVSAEFLATLGFEARVNHTSREYRADQFPGICAAISAHVLMVGAQRKMAA